MMAGKQAGDDSRAEDGKQVGKKGTRVAVIIPAYNEGQTIGQVIKAVLRCPLVDEVVVVDDGSSDRTTDEAKNAGARVIRNEHNLGKGGAMLVGARATEAGLLVFIDADLVGLDPENVTTLVEPVLGGAADMSRGLFAAGRLTTDLALKLAPFLSGQRALWRKDFLAIPDVADSRYGVEVAITRFYGEPGRRVVDVPFPGVSQVMKEEKMGFARGVTARLGMYGDIVRSFAGRHGLRRQGNKGR